MYISHIHVWLCYSFIFIFWVDWLILMAYQLSGIILCLEVKKSYSLFSNIRIFFASLILNSFSRGYTISFFLSNISNYLASSNYFCCCIAEKGNNANEQKYNMLLFFFFYNPKCIYEESKRGSKMAEFAHTYAHTNPGINLQWTSSTFFSSFSTFMGPPQDIDWSYFLLASLLWAVWHKARSQSNVTSNLLFSAHLCWLYNVLDVHTNFHGYIFFSLPPTQRM